MFSIINKVSAQLLEAYADPDSHHSDFQYYRKESGTGPRDMASVVDGKLIDMAFRMRRESPLPRRYLDIIREIMTLTPISFIADEGTDSRVQEIIDDFWDGPFNNFPQWFPEYVAVGAMTGRISLPMYLGRGGTVFTGYADPAEVTNLLPFPGNPRWMDKCDWKPVGVKEPFRGLQVIRPQFEQGKFQGMFMAANSSNFEQTDKPTNGRPDGMFYFRFNSLPNEYLGLSDLSAAIDPIAQHQDYIDSQLEQVQLLGRFIGDIEITEPGADDQTVERVKDKYRDVPGFATTIVHTSGEKHSYEASHTQAQDAAGRDKMHGNFATASLGIPPHIIRGDMADGNRAIASAANDPAYMKISAKIHAATVMAKQLVTFALHQAVRAGTLSMKDNLKFETVTPKVLRKDMHSGAFTLVAINETLQAAYQARFLDHETAKETFIHGLSEIGRDDISIDVVNKRLEAEEKEGLPRKPPIAAEEEKKTRERSSSVVDKAGGLNVGSPQTDTGQRAGNAPAYATKSPVGNGGEGRNNRSKGRT